MTARQLKPGLFIVLRQNRHANAALFERFAAQATMQPSSIVTHAFLSLLTTPLLLRFFNLALQQGDAWADVTLSHIAAVVGDTVPEVWDRELSKTETLAVWQMLEEGATLRLGDLLRIPFCGEAHTRHQQALGLHDYNTLNYLLTGNQAPGGLIWRKLAERNKA